MTIRNLLVLCGMAALAASCAEPIATPVSQESVSDISAYFWPSTSPIVTFVNANGDSSTRISFSTLSNGELAQQDSFPIQFGVSPDSVIATGFVPNSIFNLPSGDYFSSVEENFNVLPPRAEGLYTTDNVSALFVATDSGIVYYQYGSTPADTFFQTGAIQDNFIPFTGITALAAFPSYSQMLAGFSFGTLPGTVIDLNVWPPARQWQQSAMSPAPITPIQQMLAVGDTLFAISGKNGGKTGVWYWYPTAANWQQLPTAQSATVTAIGTTRNSAGDTCLFAGTTTGEIDEYDLSTHQALSGTTLSGGAITCFGGRDELLVGTTTAGVFQNDNSAVNKWYQTSIPQSSSITAIDAIGTGSSANILYVSNGNAYKSNTSGTSQSLTLHSTPAVNIGFINSGTYWVATKQDVEISENGSQLQILGGLGFWPDDTGHVTLLRSNPFFGDSSWFAGTLVNGPSERFWNITAHAIGHFDSLQIVCAGTSHTYSDVIAVRYADEVAGVNPFSKDIPYWIVYYAKDIGPVMFDELNATTNSLVERRQIKP